MTNESQQDHPGPEWFSRMPPGAPFAEWAHPVLRITVHDIPASKSSEMRTWESPDRTVMLAMPASEACRAISAAALAWEQQKSYALDERLRHLTCCLDCIAGTLEAIRVTYLNRS